MIFLSIAILAPLVFWLVAVRPWLKELRKPKPENIKIGDFTRFVFPIIRRASTALIAQQLVSVQPMTGPIGGLAFYRPRYGEPEFRTVLDDIVDALIASETDPECIAEEIVREAFKTCPYSTYYQPPNLIRSDAA